MCGVYLYGIVEGDEEAIPGIPGVDGASAVRTAAGHGLACVVSDYSGPHFKDLPKEQLVRSLLAHQRVVEHVMTRQTVLPVKFGTLLEDTQEARELLRQGHSRLAMALAFIRDKSEFEVAATWNVQQLLQQIGQEGVVVQAREAISRNGGPTLEERVRLGQVVKACMDRLRDDCREMVVAFLRPVAIDVASNPLLSDEMAMNIAFLIERVRERELDERVRQLDAQFQNKLSFRVIGPLPPYSFSTAEVGRLTPELIEEAHSTLSLGEGFSEAEVRRAYRRLAAQEQSALSPGDPLAHARLARLRQAKELLLRCCRLQTEAEENGHSLAPGRQGSGDIFVITIKRSESQDIEPARFGGALRV